jgi:hypothetical protein
VIYGIRIRTILSLSANAKAYFLGFTVLICGSGCQSFNQDEYVRTVKSARSAIPVALQIETTFDEVDHTITHYGFRNQRSNQWNTNAYFGGRYQIHMTVDVEIDYSNFTVRQLGEPEFRLYEYSKIYDPYGDKEVYGGTVGRQIEFSVEDWQKVFESKGDFSVIGVALLQNVPLKDFDRFVAGWRRDIIPIRLSSLDSIGK